MRPTSQSLAHIAVILRDDDEAVAGFTGVPRFTLLARAAARR